MTISGAPYPHVLLQLGGGGGLGGLGGLGAGGGGGGRGVRLLEPRGHVGQPRLRLDERVRERGDQSLDACKASGAALVAHAIFHALIRSLPKRIQRGIRAGV